jgi:hypothetical protein
MQISRCWKSNILIRFLFAILILCQPVSAQDHSRLVKLADKNESGDGALTHFYPRQHHRPFVLLQTINCDGLYFCFLSIILQRLLIVPDQSRIG